MKHLETTRKISRTRLLCPAQALFGLCGFRAAVLRQLRRLPRLAAAALGESGLHVAARFMGEVHIFKALPSGAVKKNGLGETTKLGKKGKDLEGTWRNNKRPTQWYVIDILCTYHIFFWPVLLAKSCWCFKVKKHEDITLLLSIRPQLRCWRSPKRRSNTYGSAKLIAVLRCGRSSLWLQRLVWSFGENGFGKGLVR